MPGLLLDAASYSYNANALPLFVTGILVLFLGTLVLVHERGARATVPYLLMAATLAMWSIGVGAMYAAANPEVAHVWSLLAHAGLIFFPVSALLFTLSVVETAQLRKWVTISGLSASTVLFALSFTDLFLQPPLLYGWGFYFSYGAVGALFIAYFFGLLGVSLLCYWKAWQSAPKGSARERRNRALLIGLSLGCFCAVDFLAAYQVAFPPLGYLAILTMFGITTFVTWRYRLVDITVEFVGEQIIETMTDALLVLDIEGNVRLVNPAARELLGRQEGEVVGQPASSLLDEKQLNEALGKLRAGESLRNAEFPYRTPEGEERTLALTASVMRDSHDQESAFVFVLGDITKRKRAEERIRFLAYFDNLTDLPNRTQFNEQLERILNDSRTHNRKLAMFFLDLDRFKRINDTLGHSAGDQLLQAVAERLRNCVRSCDFLTRGGSGTETESIVARLGGDEFIVALTDIMRAEDSAIVARRMLDVLAEPFSLENHEVFVSGSIGISLFPRDGLEAQALMKNADTAMYHAKDAGRNNYQFYQTSMNVATMERLALESDLRKAVERDEFELYYQPQVNFRSGKVMGSEALLRWRHPVRGLLAPGDFIQLAEEAGLLPEIGEWALRKACEQNHIWQTTGYGPMHVAVNFSERQFRQNNLVEIVAKALNESGMNPRSLDLELTEGVIMDNSKQTLATLYELKSMGVKVSVDDFGTGYSSLSYLKRFPVDVIKIDHSFVRDIATSSDDAAITTAIIAMARSLNLDVIAEGVETPAQADFLLEQGCQLMQGYMFGRPQAAHKFEKLLNPSIHQRNRRAPPMLSDSQVVQLR